MFRVKRTFVSVWGRRGWDACRDLWRLCVCDWERSGCDEDWYGWVLIRFLCCSYLSFSLWVFLCCSTFNLREMKCPPALELHSKCMCACARVCVCVCGAVPEGSEDWAAAFYSDWTDTNVSGICHAFTLLPTHSSVCVHVCVLQTERSRVGVCDHVVSFPVFVLLCVAPLIL